MLKDKLIEQASATPDDAKAAIVITVLADGSPSVFDNGAPAPGVFDILAAALVTLGGGLKDLGTV